MFQNILSWNQSISLLLNTLTENSIIRILLPYFSNIPIFSIPLFLLWYWIFSTIQRDTRTKEKLLAIFYAEILAGAIAMIIQQFIYVERPLVFLQNKWMFVLSHIPDNSFPSDHATIGTAFLIALFLFGFRKIFYFLFPFFIMMFLARIIGGIHYPLDIFWGIGVGILAGTTISMVRNNFILQKINQNIIKLMKKIYL